MLKKLIAMLMAAVMSVACFSTAAFANGIMPCYVYATNCESNLSISNSTATCTSKATGKVGQTTKIVIEQTLQKQTTSGSWSSVASWSKTASSSTCIATNTKSSLSSGTYRLKSVFYVYEGVNYEQITVYSSTVTKS